MIAEKLRALHREGSTVLPPRLDGPQRILCRLSAGAIQISLRCSREFGGARVLRVISALLAGLAVDRAVALYFSVSYPNVDIVPCTAI